MPPNGTPLPRGGKPCAYWLASKFSHGELVLVGRSAFRSSSVRQFTKAFTPAGAADAGRAVGGGDRSTIRPPSSTAARSQRQPAAHDAPTASPSRAWGRNPRSVRGPEPRTVRRNVAPCWRLLGPLRNRYLNRIAGFNGTSHTLSNLLFESVRAFSE
jgi:hypothetical protein